MGGAPTNIAHGKANLERVLEDLTQKYGRPVSSSSMAQKRALKAVGARKVGTINPAVPRKIGDSASGSMGEGMELLGRKHANARLQEYNRIPPATALELGRELMREHPDIDTLIYGCPHWATIESIEPLEQEFGDQRHHRAAGDHLGGHAAGGRQRQGRQLRPAVPRTLNVAGGRDIHTEARHASVCSRQSATP